METAYRASSFGAAVRYRGREGMWSWVLHRATGLGILLFLIVHVVDTALVIWWPGKYDDALAIYRHPFFRFAELGIVFSVLFHAVNGLRIIIQDFWPSVMHRQRQLVLAAGIVVLLAMLPIAWVMLAPLVGLADEPGASRHEQRCELYPDADRCIEIEAERALVEVEP